MDKGKRSTPWDQAPPPRIGIYTGRGASHSWLWFVEVFDRAGWLDLSFLTETDLQGDALHRVDVLTMSGGDTFAVAEALGPEGARKIGRFIAGGGLYVGSCAGAYLMLHSSKDHLNHFNFVSGRIANLTRTLPEPLRYKNKFCTAYGCSFVFHPVREAVQVATNGFPPFREVPTVAAPLYGGPAMIADRPAQVLATYSGFTRKTVFLVEEGLAADTVLGRAAVMRQPMGDGYLHLYGPHFEHPRFSVANRLLLKAVQHDLPSDRETLPEAGDQESISGKAGRDLVRDIKREISHSRMVAVGLETLPLQWTIGNKVYEAAKLREFIEPVWRRIKALEATDQLRLAPGQGGGILEAASRTTGLLRRLKGEIERGAETLSTARETFGELHGLTSLFLDGYFRTRRGVLHADGPWTDGSFRRMMTQLRF